MARFQVEGYDLPDQRYQKWITMYHPKSVSGSVVTVLFSLTTPYHFTSVLSKLLTQQAPKVKYPDMKSSARVLTSLENRLIQEEKERTKKQEAEKKEQRKER